MPQNSELRHWGLSLGEKSKNHKYVARVEDRPGKYKYFYTMDEYNTWKNGAKDKIAGAAKGIKSKFTGMVTKAQKQAKSAMSTASSKINSQTRRLAEEAMRSKESVTAAAKKYAQFIPQQAKKTANTVKDKLTRGDADTKKDLSRSKHATNNYPSNNYLTNPANRDPKFTEEQRATPISDAERKEYDAATRAYNVRKLKENNKSLSDADKKKLDNLEKKYNNEERGYAADDHMQYRRDQLMSFANNKRNQRPLTAQVPNTPKWQRPLENLSYNVKKGVKNLKKQAEEAISIGTKQVENARRELINASNEATRRAKSLVDAATGTAENTRNRATEEVSKAIDAISKKAGSVADMVKSGSLKLKAGQNASERQQANAIERAKTFVANLAHSYADAIGGALYDKLNPNRKDTSPAITKSQGDKSYMAKVDYPNGKTAYIKNKDDWKRFAEVTKYQNNEPDFMHSLPEIELSDDGKLPTRDEDMGEVNEKLWEDARSGKSTGYRTVNCTYCSTAYELRRRGYNVEAANLPSNITAMNVSKLYDVKDSSLKVTSKKVRSDVPLTDSNSHYGRITNRSLNSDGSWSYDVQGYTLENHDKNIKSVTPMFDVDNGHADLSAVEKAIEKQMSDFPDGSRGMFNVYWSDGGGHSMVWEKGEDGKIEIIDNQLGTKIPMDVVLSGVDPAAPIQMIRTDELKMKRGIMTRVVSN